jgi:TonB family protein
MHRFILAIAAITLATPLCASSTTSIPPQNVRFNVPYGIVTPPKVLVHPYAAYSDEARQRGIEGNVVLQAQFDEAGNVTVLKVVKGLGYGLDENAVAALKGWRFAPALQNGQPVSAIAEIEVPFRLASKHMDIKADSQVVANGHLYLEGNAEVRLSGNDVGASCQSQ